MSEVALKIAIPDESKPRAIAELIWGMDSEQQAEMFHHLADVSGDSHHLMTQFLYVRDECVDRQKSNIKDRALEGFQTMFSSAYKYMG